MHAFSSPFQFALQSVLHVVVVLLFPPLMLGVIGRTKAAFAGRSGAPVLQPYRDILKLFGKESVFSRSTTLVFFLGPVAAVATALLASLFVPLGSAPPPVSFAGDAVLFAYLLGLSRFCTVSSALDTGSAFEGMGASREASFGVLSEPAVFFGFVVLARLTEHASPFSLSALLRAPWAGGWTAAGAPLVLVAASWAIVLLAENCRIPFDDPNTHLELTMVHEVMVLDHSGPSFGLVLWGASMKLFLFGALLVRIVLPVATGDPLLDVAGLLAALLLLAVAIGVVESVLARLKLVRVPQLLVTACLLAAFGMVLNLR